MIEQQLDDLIGAVRALGDTMDEIRLDIRRMAGTGLQASAAPTATADEDAPAAEPVSVPEPTTVPEDQPSAVTRDDVVAALKALDSAKGKAAVKEVLARFEARNLTTLDAGKYGEVVDAARAAA